MEHKVYLPNLMNGRVTSFPTDLSAQTEMPVYALEFLKALASHPGQLRLSLTLHPVVQQVAQARADYCAKHNRTHHTDLEGFGPNYHVRQAGYRLPSFYQTTPEANNIESMANGYDTAAGVLDGFLKSAGHRIHILGLSGMFAAQTQMGVGLGINRTTTHQYFWAVITCPPESKIPYTPARN